jgi:hypothetical protein
MTELSFVSKIPLQKKLTLTTLSNKPLQKLIYGTAYKKATTAQLLTQALTLGYRTIDTANWSNPLSSKVRLIPSKVLFRTPRR